MRGKSKKMMKKQENEEKRRRTRRGGRPDLLIDVDGSWELLELRRKRRHLQQALVG